MIIIEELVYPNSEDKTSRKVTIKVWFHGREHIADIIYKPDDEWFLVDDMVNTLNKLKYAMNLEIRKKHLSNVCDRQDFIIRLDQKQ